MTKRFWIPVFVFFGLMLACFSRADAQDGALKVTIGRGAFGDAKEPVDRVFRIRTDFPQSLAIIITNTSSSSVSFYERAAGGAISSVSFEISDDKGNTNVVRKKKDPNASNAVGSTYMQPGEKRYFDIMLDEDTWEGSFKLYKKGSRKFKVRAVYENDFRKIYSPYYTLIVSSPEDAAKKTSADEEVTAGVLVSK